MTFVAACFELVAYAIAIFALLFTRALCRAIAVDLPVDEADAGIIQAHRMILLFGALHAATLVLLALQ